MGSTEFESEDKYEYFFNTVTGKYDRKLKNKPEIDLPEGFAEIFGLNK